MPIATYSDEIDDVPEPERCESFTGMDAFTRSTQLPPDAYQFGQNIIVQDNLVARTRPGADQLVAHTFTGKIQGVFYFDAPNIEQLIFGNAGVMYVSDSTGTYAPVPGFTLTDADVDFVAAQGVDKMLVVDGTKAAIWDGSAMTWTTFPGTNNVDPPFGASTVVFCAGRMWAAGFPGTGGAGREDDAVCFSALLDFGAGKWNTTDQSFRVGGGEGDPVRGLVKLPASVPEQEVLGVLKENSIHIIRVDPTISDPTQFQDSIASESVANGLGIVGKRAFCVLGNDLLYVAPDRSIRSLARMQAAQGQYQISPPLSLPMQPYIDRINWTHANLISAVAYKQYALFSVPMDTATTPDTVFVWNGRLQRWAGIFSGWTPNSWTVTRFSGVQNLIHGDQNGNVRKWKDTLDQTDDETYLDDGAAIATKLWLRAFLFGFPLNYKESNHAEARFSNSNAVVTFTLVCDDQEIVSWTADLRETEPNLPINLPFDLTSAQNVLATKGLIGNGRFNQCYLKIESDSGWWSLLNSSMTAFVNPLAV